MVKEMTRYGSICQCNPPSDVSHMTTVIEQILGGQSPLKLIYAFYDIRSFFLRFKFP